MKAGMRIDVDCAADAAAIPTLLDILKRHEAKATFFITTGPDDTIRNLHHYTGRKMIGLPLRRHFRGFFHSLLRKHVESHDGLKMLLDSGHEIGLHGYRHYEWLNYLHLKNREEISENISKGCDLFEQEFGFAPKSFASPGFMTSDQYLLALDDFGFDYASDFYGNRIFYPEINGKKLKTAQVPVSMTSPGELCIDDNKVLMQVKEYYNKGYFVFYIHPSYESVFRKDLLEQIFSFTGSIRTLSEIHENSSDL